MFLYIVFNVLFIFIYLGNDHSICVLHDQLAFDTAHRIRETKTYSHKRSFVLVSPTFCVDLIFVMFGNLQEHNQLWQEYVQFKELCLIWICLCPVTC